MEETTREGPGRVRFSPRALVRGAFLLFFVAACWQLWAFYRWAVGAGPFVSRPEAVTGLMPVGAFMSLFAWVKSGIFDPVMPAGVVIVLTALAVSLLLKRAFCGWICPVGAVWDGFAWLGRRVPKLPLRLPRFLDLGLRGLRYLVTAAILWWLWSVPVSQALEFQQLPYYAVADLKILSLLLNLKPVYLAVAVCTALVSIVLGNAWCRWLCPLGALYGACGAASPCTVTRDPKACTACGRCATVCHADVPVNRLESVRAPECDGCLECLRSCPAPGALTTRVAGRFAFPWWGWPLAVVLLWLGAWLLALATGHWRIGVPAETVAAYIRALRI
jgi:polyferredoxin